MEGTVTITLDESGELTMQSELPPFLVVFLLEKAKLSLLRQSDAPPPGIIPGRLVPALPNGGR